MFWKKKLSEPRIEPLLEIEKRIIGVLVENLDVDNAAKIKEQMTYLKFIRRLILTTTIVTELYPESLNAIPEEFLFPNRGEFIIANVKFKTNGLSFSTKICMVLGSLFYLKTKPNYLNAKAIDANDFQLVRIEISIN
jgi:hypothetical protein